MNCFSILIKWCVILMFLMSLSCVSGQKYTENTKVKALIIDGESSHGVWPKTTMMMKDYLEQTGMFQVDVARTTYTWQGPHYNKTLGVNDIKELLTLYPINSNSDHFAVDEPKKDLAYSPNFENYDVVISNFGWKASNWSEKTKNKFENYINNGGGLVVVHGADNSWGDWEEYNKMIALGGWGGRTTQSGPYVYYDSDNILHHDTSEGDCGSHGEQTEFQIKTHNPEHPIMKGIPETWMHSKDELYERLRGPGENMTILATGFSGDETDIIKTDKTIGRTGRNEPLLMVVNYGKGRVFHSTLGHMDYSMECVGFITTFQRGVEWAATGNVTQKIPTDFPTSDKVSIRKWNK